MRAGDAAANGRGRRRRRFGRGRRSRFGRRFRFSRGFVFFRSFGFALALRLLAGFFFFVFAFFVFARRARRGGGVAAVQAREFGQARGFGEFRAIAGDGRFHEGAPDRPRGRTAEAGLFARLRMADPDRGRVERRVADEPGVGEALRGAGLAGLGVAAHVGVAGAGAFGDHRLEDLGDLIGLPLGEDALARARFRFVDFAVGEFDTADRGRVVVDAAAGESRVAVGLFERRDADGETADPLGRHRFERGFDAHFVRRFGDVFGPDVEVELGEDDVDGVGRRRGQRHRAATRLGVVDGPGAAAGDCQRLRRAALVADAVWID